MRARFRTFSPLTFAVVSFATPLFGQATATADLNISSAYVWRGINFTNRPVVQGDVSLTLPLLGGQLVGGMWANAEPADYHGSDVLRMVAAGHSGPAVTALTPWVDLTRATGRLTTTIGATRYLYPALTGLPDAFNTTEVYARAGLAVPLAPRVAVWYDVEKVRGAYIEGSLSQTLPLGGPRSLLMSATAGFSAGQAAHADQSGYFTRDGLAFVDVGATAALPVGPIALGPALHVIYGHDDATRITGADGAPQRVKAWLGATATLSRGFGREAK